MSVRARFGFSLFANLSKAVITFGTGLLIARGLGPNQYGTMMFLLGTFTAIRLLFDGGSSIAFFTFLSQRQRSHRFVGWYFAWLGLQFFLIMLFICLLLPTSWIELIWKGEQRNTMILAFFASFMQSALWTVILQMGESQRLTRRVQGVSVSVALVHFLLMSLAWWGGWLSVHTIFGLMIIEWGIAVILVAKKLHFPVALDESDTPKSVFKEFWIYCLPLVPYSWLGFAYEFADRWLLQNYAGSVEQAYYSVAYQFGAIAAIATSSILNIFWKEIAEAHHQHNLERVGLLYQRVSRGLFFIAAFGAGFLAMWADDILRITLGTAYRGGATTLMIMFFYPLHQSMGQIGGTMAYATGRIVGYVKIGMAIMASSMVVTYIVLADTTAPFPGLGLGSIGLAGKMIVMQILSVNALAYYISRSLGIKFDWVFQPAATVACLAVGMLVSTFSRTIFDVGSQIWLAVLVAGILYAILMLALIGLFPSLAGLRRADLVDVAMKLKLIHR